MRRRKNNIIIIGAGPAGLSCAYKLIHNTNNARITLFEKNSLVGGLARTYKFKDFFFDIGPHRFFTKNIIIENIWKKILGSQLISVKRSTSILFKNTFFKYPITIDAIIKLGFFDSLACLYSYLKARVVYSKVKPKTFEEWVTKYFGKKIYTIFFKTYTEKVWGIPCNKIGAEWAAQRIKNLDFTQVILNILLRKNKVKTLADKFYYPVQGAGMFYSKISSLIKNKGIAIELEKKVSEIICHDNKVTKIMYSGKKRRKYINVDYLFSSMPITQLILSLKPIPPKVVLYAAKKLYFRDHITVNFIVKNINLFIDNWIYIHSPEVAMARVTNYNSFSRRSLKKKYAAISVEYFVFKDDAIWKLTDDQIMKLAVSELVKVRLISKTMIRDGFVVRETESYPTYYLGHKKYFNIIKNYVKKIKNVSFIGRGGMYKYNNMDHSMLSGILAAENYIANQELHNIWEINEDRDYIEAYK